MFTNQKIVSIPKVRLDPVSSSLGSVETPPTTLPPCPGHHMTERRVSRLLAPQYRRAERVAEAVVCYCMLQLDVEAETPDCSQ